MTHILSSWRHVATPSWSPFKRIHIYVNPTTRQPLTFSDFNDSNPLLFILVTKGEDLKAADAKTKGTAGKSRQTVNPPNFIFSSLHSVRGSRNLATRGCHSECDRETWRVSHSRWGLVRRLVTFAPRRGWTHAKSIVFVRASQGQRVRCLGNTNTQINLQTH